MLSMCDTASMIGTGILNSFDRRVEMFLVSPNGILVLCDPEQYRVFLKAVPVDNKWLQDDHLGTIRHHRETVRGKFWVL